MADNIDTLIAAFPEQIQQNALRQAQTQIAGQTYQQNALKLQQQIAAQNALKNIYGDPANVDPNTGLPRPAALPQLMQTGAPIGLDMVELAAKLHEQQSREAIQNMRVREYYTGMYNQDVAEPILEMMNSPEFQKLSPEERAQRLATAKVELEKTAAAMHGVPESEQDRWRNLPQPSPAWAFGNEAWKQHTQAIQKGWNKEVDPGTGKEFFWNNVYGYQHKFQGDLQTPYTEFSGVSKEQVETQGPVFTDTGVDPEGKPFTRQVVRNKLSHWVDANDPTKIVLVSPTDKLVPISTKAGAGAPIADVKNYRIPDPDNPGKTKVVPLIQPKREGEVWRKPDLTPWAGPIPDSMSEVKPSDPDAPGTGMTKPALAYIAERERLAEHMTPPGWAGAKYIPGMAENDIRTSLGLTDDALITPADARMAALNDVVTRGEIHSNKMALNVISRQNALVQSFEGTARLNANLIYKLGPTATSKGNLLWNRLSVAGRREINIDPELAKLDNAVTDFKNEYVKIMSTSAGQGGMTSDQARAEGERLFNVKQPWPVMKGALDSAVQLMKNRVDSIHGDWDATIKAIHGKGAFPEQLAPTSEQGTMPAAAQPSYALDKKHWSLPDGYSFGGGKFRKVGHTIVPTEQYRAATPDQTQTQTQTPPVKSPPANALAPPARGGEYPVIVDTQEDIDALPPGTTYNLNGKIGVRK